MPRSINHLIIVGLGLTLALCPPATANEPWPAVIDVHNLDATPEVKSLILRDPGPVLRPFSRFLNIDGDPYDDFVETFYSEVTERDTKYVIHGGPDLVGMDVLRADLPDVRPEAITRFDTRHDAVSYKFFGRKEVTGNPYPDYNGDGYSDMEYAYIFQTNTGSRFWIRDIVFGSPEIRGKVFRTYTQFDPDGSDTSWARLILHERWEHRLENIAYGFKVTGDIDGDGASDIVFRDDIGPNARYIPVEFGGPAYMNTQLNFMIIHGDEDLPGQTVKHKFVPDAGRPNVSRVEIPATLWSVRNDDNRELRLSDIDGDGVKEFSSEIWAPENCELTFNTNIQRTTAFVHNVRPGEHRIYPILTPTPSSSNTFRLDGGPATECVGDTLWASMQAGDFNGDGFDDLVMVAFPEPSPPDDQPRTELVVHFGGSDLKGANIHMDTRPGAGVYGDWGEMRLFATANFTILASGGFADLNGDGFDDLIVYAGPGLCILYGGADRPGQLLELGPDTFDVIIQGAHFLNLEPGTYQYGQADLNGDGFCDLVVPTSLNKGDGGTKSHYPDDPPRKSDYVVLFGGGDRESSRVTERFKVGEAPLRGVGSDLAPVSGMSIGFDGGEDGTGGPSTEVVTTTHNVTGITGIDGTVPELILPIYWRIESNRTGWAIADLRINYSDAEAEGHNERGIRMYEAPSPAGPWSLVANQSLLTQVNQINAHVSDFGYFALASPTDILAIRRLTDRRTNAGSLQFAVTFSSAVTGVDLGDFNLVATGTLQDASRTSLTGSGADYTVTVNSGTGDGDLRLDLVDDRSIKSVIGIPLGGDLVDTADFTGEDYALDRSQSPITNFTTTPDHEQLLLIWNDPTESDFETTHIRWHPDHFPQDLNDGQQLYEGLAENVIHTGLENDVTYNYSAFSRDDLGNYSDPVHTTGAPVEDPCVIADVNRDGNVNIIDVFEEAFAIINEEFFEEGDINKDGRLNIIDLQIVVNCILARE
jgi:hypothetical protein